jgi:hypothetical protein
MCVLYSMLCSSLHYTDPVFITSIVTLSVTMVLLRYFNDTGPLQVFPIISLQYTAVIVLCVLSYSVMITVI